MDWIIKKGLNYYIQGYIHDIKISDIEPIHRSRLIYKLHARKESNLYMYENVRFFIEYSWKYITKIFTRSFVSHS